MRRKLIAVVVLAALILMALRAVQTRTDLFADTKERLTSKLLQGGLLAAAALIGIPFLSFWTAIAVGTGILAATGALFAINKALSPGCPDGMVMDDDSDVCLGMTL